MGHEFDTIKRAVTAEQAALNYGLEVNRRTHRAKCPFHNGAHENLSFHGGGYRCWVCGASGTSIDFTMNYLGLSSAMDAARRLDRDFGMGLFDKKPTIRSSWGKSRAEELKRLGDAFIRWCEIKYPEWRDSACRYSYELRSGYNHRLHSDMLSCGRKYALLRRFLLDEIRNGGSFNILFIAVASGTDRTAPLDKDIQRLCHLFAVDRQNARLVVEELEQSGFTLLKQDAHHLREVYCLD